MNGSPATARHSVLLMSMSQLEVHTKYKPLQYENLQISLYI